MTLLPQRKIQLIAVIADIARHRRNRKGKNIPRISADERGSGKSLTAKDAKSAKRVGKTAPSQYHDGATCDVLR
jgi:hypothetical protein